jgi:hypothetical protein
MIPEPRRALSVAVLLLVLAPAARADTRDGGQGGPVAAIATLEDMLDSMAPAADGPAARTERTLAVRRGSILTLENFAGDIAVRAGEGNRVRVVASHSNRERVVVRSEGRRVIVDSDSDRPVPASVHYEITVPEWMDLDLSGFNSDISVEGVTGEVKAETVQGNIDLVRSGGPATLSTVEGGVRVERSRGRVDASAINGSVRIRDARGAVSAESVNGNIALEDVASDSVDASTVNGPVRFAGAILPHGFYRLTSHNGSIRMALPKDADARVLVATYSGGFDCSFPISLHETKKGREYEVTLGSGSARVTLETFQGWVLLRRPGEADGDDHGSARRVKEQQRSLERLEQRARDEESGGD